jgi:hypothetical protein
MPDATSTGTTFQGEVYQLTFDADLGFCTASLRNEQGNLTVTTLEPRMQTILETAMVKSMRASVTYIAGDTNNLRNVSLDID